MTLTITTIILCITITAAMAYADRLRERRILTEQMHHIMARADQSGWTQPLFVSALELLADMDRCRHPDREGFRSRVWQERYAKVKAEGGGLPMGDPTVYQ